MGKQLAFSSVILVVSCCAIVVRSDYDLYKPDLKISSKSYAGVGFASYNAPVLSFGGYNGQMSAVGYGPPIGAHIARQRREIANAEPSSLIWTAVNKLIFRNDTMCLGLAVCRTARADARDAQLLKNAFQATRNLRGVNFIEYAVAHAAFPRETCEEAFVPCPRIKEELSHSLLNVLRIAANTRREESDEPTPVAT